jgi:hypothetical protein
MHPPEVIELARNWCFLSGAKSVFNRLVFGLERALCPSSRVRKGHESFLIFLDLVTRKETRLPGKLRRNEKTRQKAGPV